MGHILIKIGLTLTKFKLTMKIKVLKTEEDYNQALSRLEIIFDAPIDSKDGDEADLLGMLIDKYEDEHYPINAPDPIEAIKFRMEQMNMDNNDLAKIIGYKSRVSEIFNRKRKLSLKMIRNLHEKLKIPYESLITD
jgi:HTH-type transcriptional regulator/antitoxin HigA